MERKLKKLELKKHVIVELSEDESRQVQGGTTWGCFYASVTLTSNIVSGGQDASWWRCEPGANTDVTCYGLYGGCNISEIGVTP